MNDRETIIRVLKEIANDKRMLNHADYWALICAEAAELLKAQEPVKPRVGHDGWYRCGGCNNSLASGERVDSDGFLAHPWPHYCEMCGRAVKWE